MWRHVYHDFADLSKSEQLALFEAMKQDLFPKERVRQLLFSAIHKSNYSTVEIFRIA